MGMKKVILLFICVLSSCVGDDFPDKIQNTDEELKPIEVHVCGDSTTDEDYALEKYKKGDTIGAYAIWLQLENSGHENFKDTIDKYIGHHINLNE